MNVVAPHFNIMQLLELKSHAV